jgi:hypothetical protein
MQQVDVNAHKYDYLLHDLQQQLHQVMNCGQDLPQSCVHQFKQANCGSEDGGEDSVVEDDVADVDNLVI